MAPFWRAAAAWFTEQTLGGFSLAHFPACFSGLLSACKPLKRLASKRGIQKRQVRVRDSGGQDREPVM